jgi:phosphoribosylformimino-5-aminoimidazole carboxamide ribotide isomerase
VINSWTNIRIDSVQIIPVIDLKGGLVVHARRGERETYQPIRSSLARGADPVEITAALLRLHPFQTLYLADIDAIQRRGSNVGKIEAIHDAFPQVELWVDAGIADHVGLTRWRIRNLGRAVIGTECEPDATLVAALRSMAAGPSPVLSLDFGAHGLCGSADLLARPDAWPGDVIVMTLARVGSGAGPDLETLAAVLAQSGGRRVFAAGGIRDADDLEAVRRLGVSGALVASSLHDGRLSASDLARGTDSHAADRGES